MLRALLVIGALLGLALPASAVVWQKNCQSTDTGSTSASAGSFYCSSPTSNATDTDIIDVHQCLSFDILQFDDKDGSGTVALTTGTPQLCPSRSLTGTAADNGCTAVPGTTPPLAADDADYALGGVYFRVQAGGTDTNATQMRWMLVCTGSSEE